MAQKTENLRIRVPIIPELDQRGTKRAQSDLNKFAKELQKIDPVWKSIGKTASLNVKEISKISSAVGQFSKGLSSGFKESVKELGSLKKKLEDAQQKANELAKAHGEAKGGKKAEIGGQVAQQAKLVKDLNNQIAKQSKEASKYTKDLQNLSKFSQKQQKLVEKAVSSGVAGYNPKDAIKDFITKLSGKDVKGALGAVVKGGAGAYARGAEATGGAEGAQQMAALGSAAGSMAIAAAAVMAFVKLILAASDHMAGLNKALTGGIGLAQEMGGSIGQYSKSIKDLRNAAIDAAGAWLKYGISTEKGLESVNAFAKQSGMSMAQLEVQLKDMGQGDLDRGMREFAINAQVYGKALGMEGKDAAAMMGQFVNEVGISADNVTQTMGDIVKQAAQAGMPTQKFMDIFRQAIPNLDLFTNRIEELTGVMKMLSKTMDPRAVQGFMSAMGKGFDQMDFKQRLKMALVIGPGEMSRIMKDDIGRAAEAVKKGLKGVVSSKQIDEALKGGGNIKKMRKLAAEAMAKGATGAQVSELNRLGRYKELQGGGVLKQASGMREMGLMGRMESLQKLAGRFTGGDISGLGEHVAKQLGVSESEYKAILGMQDSLGDYSAAIEDSGRTSSKSINAGLAKILNLPDPISDPKEFELATKKAQKKDPAGFKKALMTAATMQIEEQDKKAKDDEKDKESIEDLTADQVSATQSLGDKIENVIAVLLEKLYFVMDEIFGFLGDLYSALPGWLSHNYGDVKKAVDGVTAVAKKELAGNTQGLNYYQETVAHLKDMSDRGATTEDYMKENQDLLTEQLHGGKQSTEYYQKMAKDLDGVMSSDDAAKFIKASQDGEIQTTSELLKGLDPTKAAILMAKLAADKAKGMKGFVTPEKVKTTTKSEERAAKKQAQLASLESDHDDRAEQLAKEQGKDIADIAAAASPPGAPPGKEDLADKGAPTTAGVVPPAAMAAGTPGAAPTPAQQATSSAQQATAENTEQQAETAEEAAAKADAQYQASTDTLSLLKKGIKFEQSWMGTKFRNVLKEASLDALRPALAEQIIAYAKIWEDKDLRAALAGDKGAKLAGAGVSMGDLIGLKGGDDDASLNALLKSKGVPGFAAGGMVQQTGPILAHAGEMVTSAADVRRGGGGGKTINAVVYAQGVPANQIGYHLQKMSRSP